MKQVLLQCVSSSEHMQLPPTLQHEVICSIDFDSSVMFIMRLPVIVGVLRQLDRIPSC